MDDDPLVILILIFFIAAGEEDLSRPPIIDSEKPETSILSSANATCGKYKTVLWHIYNNYHSSIYLHTSKNFYGLLKLNKNCA